MPICGTADALQVPSHLLPPHCTVVCGVVVKVWAPPVAESPAPPLLPPNPLLLQTHVLATLQEGY